VFLGPPGAGKGTQAERLRDEFGLAHLATGDLLRAAVAGGTHLGREAQRYMDAGELVPDDVVIGMIRERLADGAASAFLLDGFPRSVPQAEALDATLADLGAPLDAVIAIEVGRDELIKRMLGRKRPDDTPQTVENRLRVYEDQTTPLFGYYGDRGLLRIVQGEGSVDEVYGSIKAAVPAQAG